MVDTVVAVATAVAVEVAKIVGQARLSGCARLGEEGRHTGIGRLQVAWDAVQGAGRGAAAAA